MSNGVMGRSRAAQERVRRRIAERTADYERRGMGRLASEAEFLRAAEQERRQRTNGSRRRRRS